jgi:hypothetical protein
MTVILVTYSLILLEQGLLRDDLILSFGTLIASAFTGSSLQPLATLVASQENVRCLFCE